jgi:membrane protein
MWEMLKETFFKWYEDNPGQRGAALAFYAIFAIAPLLLIAVAIAGSVFGIQATENQIVGALQGLVGPEIAAAIQATIKSASKPDSGRFATLVGLATSFLGALGVMGELQSTLNTIWQVKPKPGRGVLGWLRGYGVSFLMVLGIGFFLLLSLVVSTGTSALGQSVSTFLPGSIAVWQWAELLVSFVLITVLFALTYKAVPSVRVAWRDVWVGAAVTSVLFTFGKFLIGWYLVSSSVGSAYGAAGSVIVILLWVYYSAQVCLFGAEFTWVHAHRFGAGMTPTKHAILAATPQATPEQSRRKKRRRRKGTET